MSIDTFRAFLFQSIVQILDAIILKTVLVNTYVIRLQCKLIAALITHVFCVYRIVNIMQTILHNLIAQIQASFSLNVFDWYTFQQVVILTLNAFIKLTLKLIFRTKIYLFWDSIETSVNLNPTYSENLTANICRLCALLALISSILQGLIDSTISNLRTDK